MSEKKQITLRLPDDLYERIQQEAERENIIIEQKLIDILFQGLNFGLLTKQISLTFQYAFERFVGKLKKIGIPILIIFVLIQVFLLKVL